MDEGGATGRNEDSSDDDEALKDVRLSKIQPDSDYHQSTRVHAMKVVILSFVLSKMLCSLATDASPHLNCCAAW